MNTCELCKIEYAPNTGRGAHPSRFCSRKCASRALYLSKNPPVARDCAECGEQIPGSRRADSRFCSLACGYRFNYRKAGPSANLRRFGMTADDFAALLAAQGGTCAIPGCDVAIDGNGRRLHVDHDHACCPGRESCGKCIRGLLCGRHNVGLGMFADDPAMLRAAADYLESVRV